jgi:diguanylate cyclase (GGDEF)-like protein
MRLLCCLLCWLSAAFVAGPVHAGAGSGIARVERLQPSDSGPVALGPAMRPRVDDPASPTRLLAGMRDGRGVWRLHPEPQPEPHQDGSGDRYPADSSLHRGGRLLLVYHPYSARVSVTGADGATATRSLFDRELDPRLSRRALAFAFTGNAPLTVAVEVARYPLQVQVRDIDEYLASDLAHVRLLSVVTGVLAGIALVVLVFWLLLRERVYLLYAATVALQMLYLLCAYGEAYAMPGLRLLAPLAAPGIWTVATVATAAASLFLLELADLGRHAPWLSRTLRWVGAWVPLALLVPLWLPWPADKDWFPPTGNLLLMLANVIALAALTLAWFRGNRRAAYALLAWVPLVAMSTARALQLSAGVPLTGFVEYGFPIVLALSSILLVLILADRMLTMRRERDDAQHHAESDPLTGSYNREGIARRLEEELAIAEQQGRDLSVLFLDLDHFKSINDSHGHAVGDACLRSMVRAGIGELEAHDMVGRFGGEEFLVLLPGSNRRQALDAAERIRRVVEARCAMVADVPVALTVSIGVAERSAGDTPDTLMRRADDALYAAKRAGRNRVVAAGSQTSQRVPAG